MRTFRNFTDFQNVTYNVAGFELNNSQVQNIKNYNGFGYINKKKVSLSESDLDTIEIAKCEFFITRAINDAIENGNKVFFKNGEFSTKERLAMSTLSTIKADELIEVLNSLNIEIVKL